MTPSWMVPGLCSYHSGVCFFIIFSRVTQRHRILPHFGYKMAEGLFIGDGEQIWKEQGKIGGTRTTLKSCNAWLLRRKTENLCKSAWKIKSPWNCQRRKQRKHDEILCVKGGGLTETEQVFLWVQKKSWCRINIWCRRGILASLTPFPSFLLFFAHFISSLRGLRVHCLLMFLCMTLSVRIFLAKWCLI